MKKQLILEKEAKGLEDSKLYARELAGQINTEDTILLLWGFGFWQNISNKRNGVIFRHKYGSNQSFIFTH